MRVMVDEPWDDDEDDADGMETGWQCGMFVADDEGCGCVGCGFNEKTGVGAFAAGGSVVLGVMGILFVVVTSECV